MFNKLPIIFLVTNRLHMENLFLYSTAQMEVDSFDSDFET